MRRMPETAGSNPGLALARYVPVVAVGRKTPKERSDFFNEVEALTADESYKVAFARWKRTAADQKALTANAVLGGPLAVGLGNESSYEAGLTLHRTYGMPVIPGSAIKGACLRAASGQDAATFQAAKALFGDQAQSGRALFHDAWYDPTSGPARPLTVDTVTVHHPKYYQVKGADSQFPTDFDDPVPSQFVAVRPGVQFYFAIEIPGEDSGWLDFAEAMLRYSLTEVGLGGKTNAGYGWFKDAKMDRPPIPLTPEQLLEGHMARIRDVRNVSDLSQKAIEILAGAESPEVRHLVAAALMVKAKSLKKWGKDTAEKSWRKAIQEAL